VPAGSWVNVFDVRKWLCVLILVDSDYFILTLLAVTLLLLGILLVIIIIIIITIIVIIAIVISFWGRTCYSVTYFLYFVFVGHNLKCSHCRHICRRSNNIS
jgi:hypothetical protein